MADRRYYVETDEGRDWYATEAEAREAVQREIDALRPCDSGECWPAEVMESISWGLELGTVEVTQRGLIACPECDDSPAHDPRCESRPELQEWVEYGLVPHETVRRYPVRVGGPTGHDRTGPLTLAVGLDDLIEIARDGGPGVLEIRVPR